MALKCERPAWTGCLIVLWLLLLPSVLLTHIAIDKLIAPMRDLPANIVNGFDNVFKFAALEASSSRLKDYSVTAMEKCNWTGNATSVDVTSCISAILTVLDVDGHPVVNFSNQSVDTGPEKNAILAEFDSNLNTVVKVTNDKYFGISGMQNTANELNKIISETSKVNNRTNCGIVIGSYCTIWISADAINKGMSDVNGAIDLFKGGEQIKMYNEHASELNDLHSLPYSAVFAILFLTCFHAKGGVCCCCRGGSKCACLAVLPFIVLWLVSFVIWVIILAVGYVVKTRQDDIDLTFLKGSPTMKEAIEHVQTNYSEFWKVVFEDLESGLVTLWIAAWLFTIFNIWIVFFFSCECCCRPFVKDEDDREQHREQHRGQAYGKSIL